MDHFRCASVFGIQTDKDSKPHEETTQEKGYN